jgi:hypothetical protein
VKSKLHIKQVGSGTKQTHFPAWLTLQPWRLGGKPLINFGECLPDLSNNIPKECALHTHCYDHYISPKIVLYIKLREILNNRNCTGPKQNVMLQCYTYLLQFNKTWTHLCYIDVEIADYVVCCASLLWTELILCYPVTAGVRVHTNQVPTRSGSVLGAVPFCLCQINRHVC